MFIQARSVQRHASRVMSYFYPIGCRIVIWVATADGCVHTADNSTRQHTFSTCSVSKFSTKSVVSRRELVANSMHTARRVKTSTRLNSTVASRRRCVLGFRINKPSHTDANSVQTYAASSHVPWTYTTIYSPENRPLWCWVNVVYMYVVDSFAIPGIARHDFNG